MTDLIETTDAMPDAASGFVVPPAVADALSAGAGDGAGAAQPAPTRTGSGLRRTLWLQLDDGTEHTVTTTVADALRYERTYKKPLFDGVGVTQMVFLGWSALRRTGAIDVKYPEFEHQVADFEDITDDSDDADPTQPDH